MKIRNKKNIIAIFLLFAFGILLAGDFYIIKIKSDKEKFLSNNIVKNKINKTPKNFNYSDMLNALDNCSTKFVLIKIENNDINKSFINTEVKYKGGVEELLTGMKIMKTQEIVSDINEINIEKTENEEYIAEINVDFLKFK